MKLGPWLYILMIITGIFSYYASEPILYMMPQDGNGNLVWPYQTLPVMLNLGGWGLIMFGLLYAGLACETELISRHKQNEIQQEEKKKCQQ